MPAGSMRTRGLVEAMEAPWLQRGLLDRPMGCRMRRLLRGTTMERRAHRLLVVLGPI